MTTGATSFRFGSHGVGQADSRSPNVPFEDAATAPG